LAANIIIFVLCDDNNTLSRPIRARRNKSHPPAVHRGRVRGWQAGSAEGRPKGQHCEVEPPPIMKWAPIRA
jgi:hypothetical protein